jgi:hypothetical protein
MCIAERLLLGSGLWQVNGTVEIIGCRSIWRLTADRCSKKTWLELGVSAFCGGHSFVGKCQSFLPSLPSPRFAFDSEKATKGRLAE